MAHERWHVLCNSEAHYYIVGIWAYSAKVLADNRHRSCSKLISFSPCRLKVPKRDDVKHNLYIIIYISLFGQQRGLRGRSDRQRQAQAVGTDGRRVRPAVGEGWGRTGTGKPKFGLWT